jgi:hypothetical protein
MKPLSKPSPLIRHSEAAELLTSRAVLLACEEAGWLKPCVKRKKMTIYNRADVLAAAQRILSGEYPNVQGCKSQNTTVNQAETAQS